MTRTLFIGLDGATFTILDAMMGRTSEGGAIAMPFLRGLIEGGVRAELRSTANPLTPPAWVSLMTGRTPGHHGVYDFLRAEERDEEVFFTLSDARDVRVETIWSIASRQKRKIVALNFPITAPPRTVNGCIVPGFVPWKHLRRNVTPPSLFDRLKALPGFDAKELAWDFEREAQAMYELSRGEMADWLRYHIARERQWFRIAEVLLEEERPDLMAVMFDGTDKIQHQAWEYLTAPSGWTNGSSERRLITDLCNEYFSRLDNYIEQLISLAGPDTQVFFASDHGFTGSTEVVRINQILHDLGYVTWRDRDDSEASKRREKSWFADLDWKRTTAYCRTPSSNGICIRVAPRPGAPGIPREEYEPFRERLIAALAAYKDESGAPVIREIHKREDVFPGPAMLDAPDLLLVLRDYGFVSIADQRPAVQTRESVAGTHHPDGIFMAYGPGIRAGVSLPRRNIVDVAATLLYSVGLPIPADFEGRVVEGCFTEEHLRQRAIREGSPTLPVKHGETQAVEMAADEKEKIMEQLKMLGYMD